MSATREERPLGMGGRVALAMLLVAGIAVAVLDPFSTLLFLVYVITGYILAVRRPRELLGWLLIAIAFGFLGTTVPVDLDTRMLTAGTASWRDFLVVWEAAWSGYTTFSGFVALMLVFPAGHLPVRRRRAAQVLLAGCAALCVIVAVAPFVAYNPDQGVTTVLVPNRFAILPDSPLWALIPVDALIVPMIVAMAIGIAWMLGRYRRATGIERLQLRWLVAALSAVVIAVAAGLSSLLLLGDIGGAAWVPAAFSFPLVPVAILVAVTRYRLYEIDRIVSRTIGWVVVTAMLAAVFAVAIIALQAVLSPITGNNTLAVAASTLVAAALFQPLRARVQRTVDRRFNRARVDAQHVTEAFGTHVRENVDLAVLHERLLAAVDGTVQPSGAGIWIRGTER